MVACMTCAKARPKRAHWDRPNGLGSSGPGQCARPIRSGRARHKWAGALGVGPQAQARIDACQYTQMCMNVSQYVPGPRPTVSRNVLCHAARAAGPIFPVASVPQVPSLLLPSTPCIIQIVLSLVSLDLALASMVLASASLVLASISLVLALVALLLTLVALVLRVCFAFVPSDLAFRPASPTPCS